MSARSSLFGISLASTLFSCGATKPTGTDAVAPRTDGATGAVCATSHAATPSTDGGAKLVVAIEVRGARDGRALCGLITSKVDEAVSPDIVDADIAKIWSRGTVDDVVARAEPSAGGQRLVFDVHERDRITGTRIDGLEKTNIESRDAILLPAGPLDPASVMEKERALLEQLKAAGFRHPEVRHHTEPGDGDKLELVFEVTAGPESRVAKIEFPKIDPARAKELQKLFITTPGGRLDEDALARDAMVAASYYYDRGMLKVDVHDPEVKESPDGTNLDVTINIEEGPVYHVGKVSFAGDLLDRAPSYVKRFWSLPQGAVFNRSTVAADLDKLDDYHRGQRFPAEHSVETNIDEKKHTVDVTVRLTKATTPAR